MNTTQSTDMSPPATQRQNVSQESKNGDMNRERILEMARAAGMVRTHPGMAPEVLAFAALVATAEREACAKACEELHHTWRWDDEPDSTSVHAIVLLPSERGNHDAKRRE
ncbi:hypothetical protein [Comamonas serinivorans]|uniref:hypothetical protein n=1 Tax=Comamonas serinivorans TaxID=1082851 RepID=UPI0012F74143|nr:hypothetical protein [Comamonas serinivorans]